MWEQQKTQNNLMVCGSAKRGRGVKTVGFSARAVSRTRSGDASPHSSGFASASPLALFLCHELSRDANEERRAV
ncbi:hypothetical protein RRG08_065061 [Elysia crispata]|uniref:Uncharacterized protein n=1 Tax=Elysia crispata TaxID=231223 RepID=A0AAE0ZKN8_9GAST|nr:hypothetical protein RRG08_065061 [Elysia crispata]